MAEFESWWSYWWFEREVSRDRRYFRSETSERLLAAGVATGGSRVQYVPEARNCDENAQDQLPEVYEGKRMKPLADRAKEGGVNPIVHQAPQSSKSISRWTEQA